MKHLPPAGLLPPVLEELAKPERRPLVHLSWAQSLDGRIATARLDSRGLSGPESMELTHGIRAESDTILVGIGTALADDPRLNCRSAYGCPDPALRVVLDSRLRLPLDSTLVRTAKEQGTLVYCRKETLEAPGMDRRVADLQASGVMVQAIDGVPGAGLELGQVLADLDRRGRRIVFVEGGGAVLTAFAKAGLVDVMTVFLSPRLIGGGVEAFGDLGRLALADAPPCRCLWYRQAGCDLVWRLVPA